MVVPSHHAEEPGSSTTPFFDGGGEMGELIRRHDWERTPLGPLDAWPQSLRSALSICLNSSFPTAIYWGPDLLLLYNDAWAPIPADRHPWALGRPGAEVWADIWPVVGPQFSRVIETGEGFSTYDQMLPMVRGGIVHETYWNYSFTPILGEDGGVAGIFNQGHETTDRVLGERRQAFRLALAEGLRKLSDPAEVLEEAARLLALHLGASRVVYAEDLRDGETIVVTRDYARGVPSIVGRYRYADYGADLLAELRHGRAVPRPDIASDPTLTAAEKQAHAALQLGATLSVPLMKEGRLIAVLGVHYREPHAFQQEEISLVAEVAERTWEAVERARAGTALAAEAERVQLALDAGAIAGTWVWDVRDNRFTADERFARTFGLAPEVCRSGLPLENVMRSIHDADRARVAAAVDEALARGGAYRCEYRVRRSDGMYCWVEANGRVELDESRRAARFPGVLLNIEDRRNAEAALRDSEARLRDSEARYRTLFESIDEGFCVIEFIDGPHGALSDYVHIEANTAYSVNTGIPDIVGKRLREIVGEEADTWAETYRQVLLTGEPIRFERELVATGRFLELAAFRIDPQERRQVAVLFKDVTARKRAEVELRQLNAELSARVSRAVAEREAALAQVHEMQKLETIGQLTGGIAHDFNNLLTPIVGGLDILRRRFGQEERAARTIDGALQSAERARVLVGRLLAFARRQHLEAQPTSVRDLVVGMTELIDRSLGPQISVSLDLPDDLPAVIVDPGQLELALLNLAVNARDAMPGGGTLTIAARRHESRHEAPRLTAGLYVCVSVEDTGTGMDAETLRRAIEPFYTTKGVGRGTGLGLSMVHGLAAQSGGALVLESVSGKGTKASLFLPVTDSAIERAELAGRDEPVAGQPPLSILLVDDEELVRLGTADILESLGHTVMQAASAAAALQIAQSGAKIDLVVTDYMMPSMTGIALVREIRRSRPGTPCLLITGYAALDASVAGDMPRVGKPFRAQDLAKAIAEVAARETPTKPPG